MSIITYLNPDAIRDRSITKEKIDASVLDAKQDSLVSGTNIKTINGESVLGSGDITITSSGGAYPEVNHGTGDTTFTLTPNTFHVWDEVTSLTLNFGLIIKDKSPKSSLITS